MPGERLEADPEVRLQQARELAWRALDRREHTVAEVRGLLERKRVDPEAAAAVLGELVEGGWLDDAAFARRFAEDRRNLDGWGSERIERRLRSLGVAGDDIDAAVGTRDQAGELEAAVELLGRRFPQPLTGPRDAQRALGVLVRKGYDLELAHDALRRHAGRDSEEW